MKNFNILGSLKNPTFRGGGGGSRKTNIEGGIAEKGGLGQFTNLRGAWQERGGCVLEGG